MKLRIRIIMLQGKDNKQQPSRAAAAAVIVLWTECFCATRRRQWRPWFWQNCAQLGWQLPKLVVQLTHNVRAGRIEPFSCYPKQAASHKQSHAFTCRREKSVRFSSARILVRHSTVPFCSSKILLEIDSLTHLTLCREMESKYWTDMSSGYLPLLSLQPDWFRLDREMLEMESSRLWHHVTLVIDLWIR